MYSMQSISRPGSSSWPPASSTSTSPIGLTTADSYPMDGQGYDTHVQKWPNTYYCYYLTFDISLIEEKRMITVRYLYQPFLTLLFNTLYNFRGSQFLFLFIRSPAQTPCSVLIIVITATALNSRFWNFLNLTLPRFEVVLIIMPCFSFTGSVTFSSAMIRISHELSNSSRIVYLQTSRMWDFR